MIDGHLDRCCHRVSAALREDSRSSLLAEAESSLRGVLVIANLDHEVRSLGYVVETTVEGNVGGDGGFRPGLDSGLERGDAERVKQAGSMERHGG